MANENLDLDDIQLDENRPIGDDGDLVQEGEGFVVGGHVVDLEDLEGYEDPEELESLEDVEGFGGFEGLTRSRPLPD